MPQSDQNIDPPPHPPEHSVSEAAHSVLGHINNGASGRVETSWDDLECRTVVSRDPDGAIRVQVDPELDWTVLRDYRGRILELMAREDSPEQPLPVDPPAYVSFIPETFTRLWAAIGSSDPIQQDPIPLELHPYSLSPENWMQSIYSRALEGVLQGRAQRTPVPAEPKLSEGITPGRPNPDVVYKEVDGVLTIVSQIDARTNNIQPEDGGTSPSTS